VTATLDDMQRRPGWAGDTARLRKAWDALVEVTQTLIMIDDAAVRLANATPYLEAFGHVVVGWLWLEQARVTFTAKPAGAADEAFYAGKQQTARWFLRWEIPKVHVWLAVLAPPDPSVLEMQDAWF
jgi:hypothetical protein